MSHGAGNVGTKLLVVAVAALLFAITTGCHGTHRHHRRFGVAQGPVSFPPPAPAIREAPKAHQPEPTQAAEGQPAATEVASKPVAPAKEAVESTEPLAAPPQPVRPTCAVVIVGASEGAEQLEAWIQEEMLIWDLHVAAPEAATHCVRVEVGVRTVLDLGGDRALASGRAGVSLFDVGGRLLDRATVDRRSDANGTESMARDQVRARLAAAVAWRVHDALARTSEQEAKSAPSGTGDANDVLNRSGDPVKKDV